MEASERTAPECHARIPIRVRDDLSRDSIPRDELERRRKVAREAVRQRCVLCEAAGGASCVSVETLSRLLNDRRQCSPEDTIGLLGIGDDDPRSDRTPCSGISDRLPPDC